MKNLKIIGLYKGYLDNKSNSKINSNHSSKNNIPIRKINNINENTVKSPSVNEHFLNKIRPNSGNEK